MSLADFKTKKNAIIKSVRDKENSISKKLESIGRGFKYTPTILAHDLKIDGVITSLGLIEIEGLVKGIINGNSVILRENGFVEGTIIAESLSLKGKFEGIIRARNITISSKARIYGEIEYESLVVEDGAYVEGQFKRLVLVN
jgi:cytoskeletal protein CcmA (bactofilin family)